MTVTIALPSKGRMKDESSAIFERAGMRITAVGNDRSYRGRVEGVEDVEITFLSASEIAREIGSGAVDFGVTGEDLVREGLADADARVEFAARLGFGHADVVVAVPEIWYDVDTMADLGDVAADFRARHGRRLAIATKYWRLTQQFFSGSHGIQLYRIVESSGSDRGCAGIRLSRHHRRHHLDRLDAQGQPSEDSLRWRDPSLRGLPRTGAKGGAWGQSTDRPDSRGRTFCALTMEIGKVRARKFAFGPDKRNRHSLCWGGRHPFDIPPRGIHYG